MPRSAAVSVENNFINGLVTQATALNFPEAACTETYNCVFRQDGAFERRKGLDFESSYSLLTDDRSGKAIRTFAWYNAAGSGEYNFIVLQVGMTLYFYSVSAGALSDGLVSASTINVSTYLASGAPTNPEQTECQFASGKGYLFVTHPYCEPFYVTYTPGTNSFSAAAIYVYIRDTEGVSDGYTVSERRAAASGMSNAHKYNLYNQGWAPFSTGGLNDPRPSGGTTVTNSQVSLPTSYDAGNPLATWQANRTDQPSNADVWWLYKDSQDVFQPKIASAIVRGNSPAPKGYYQLYAFSQDRGAAAGLSGISTVTSSYFRPRSCAFFAGRVWYGGVDYSGFNNKVYFSQIVQGTGDFGSCYQQNDPTAEHSNDILSTDGGVIQILDLGSVIRMVAIASALVIFATNGVWTISGSTGTGFTPTDFAVQRISSMPNLSHSSFVDVGGYPAWWTNDGIYMISGVNGTGQVQITSLSEKKIKDFFIDEIPAESKRYAKGFFNPLTKVIQWCYSSTSPTAVGERYEYDRILCFNVVTQAFYPWSLPSNNVKINGVVAIRGFASSSVQVTTTVSGATVTVGGATVYSEGFTESEQPSVFKYLCSYSNAGTYKITFAEEYDTDYADFVSYDSTGSDYESYLISGYKVRGDAQKRFQSNYVMLFCDMEQLSKFDFQAVWDYATTATTNEFGTAQRVDTSAITGRAYKFRRLKIRGMGLSVQFKITSVPGEPFRIVGWSTYDTVNNAV